MFASQTKPLFETPHSLVYSRKLDTALRQSTVTSFFTRLSSGELTKDDKLITYHYDPQYLLSLESDPSVYAIILGQLIIDSDNGEVYGDHHQRKVYSDIQEATNLIIETQIQVLLQNYHMTNRDAILGQLILDNRRKRIPPYIKNILIILEQLTKVIERSNAMYTELTADVPEEEQIANACKTNRYQDPNNLFQFTWSSKIVIIQTEDVDYVLPRPYILLIHNKFADLVSIALLHQALEGNQFPPSASTKLYMFVKCLQRLCVIWKNDYFKIAKCLESLVIAETIAEVEGWDNTDFIDNITKELKADPGFKYSTSRLRYLLKNMNISYRNELGCLSKIMGHPLVDMEGGARKLHEKTNMEYDVDPVAIQDSINLWKKSYIKNHILKYGKWPPCTLTGIGCPKPLLMAYVYGRDPDSAYVRNKWGVVADNSYVWVSIEQNMRYDKLENVIPYLKDKTISLLRSDVFSKYLEQANKHAQTRWTDTRLLLYYMVRSSCDATHLEFLKKYEEQFGVEEIAEYLVIRIVPKEKELKDLFRGFGCQTYKNRMRCLVQEKAGMKYLELFSDEQAMSLGELDLTKKLYAWRRLSLLYQNHTVLYLNLDASSWNNAFRDEVVSTFMVETMDKIYNTRLFSRTHKAYKRTLFYVPDEDNTFYWDGQAGGIEGLNQDTWVIVYISQIKVAMKGMGMKYLVLCKGDDLRLAILIPNNMLRQRSVKQIKERITASVSEVAAKFGHTIKIIDSYASERYLNFGKYPSVGMIELSQGSRKIQKTYGANNAFLPTLDDYIGSTFSNAHSTSRVLPHGVMTYRVAVVWSCWYLRIHPTYRGCSPLELTALNLVPSMLGGFPIIYLSNFLVRAESDLLAPFLSILQYCETYNHPLYMLMSKFCVLPRSVRSRNIKMICKDPYSLPNDRPALPASYLRTQLVVALKPLVRNEDLVQLFKALDSKNTEKVLKTLDSANVINAKVFAAIYSCTPEGLVDELVKKFESARSIMEVVVLRRGGPYAKKMLIDTIYKETKLQKWRYDRLKGVRGKATYSFIPFLTPCPGESADQVRMLAWGKRVEGITNPPLDHQIKLTPAAQLNHSPWDIDNHFMLTFSTPEHYLPGQEHEMAWSAGELEPFNGCITSKGVVPPAVRFIDKDPLLEKLSNLLEIDSWTYTSDVAPDGSIRTSNFRLVIASVLRLFTEKSLTELNLFAAVRVRGTTQHHLATRGYKQSIVPNSLSNLYTSFEGNSGTHNRIRNIPGHYKMNYRYIFAYSVMMVTFELSVAPTTVIPKHTWIVTKQCNFCTTPITETPIIVDPSLLPTDQDHRLVRSRLAAKAFKQLETAVQDYAGHDYVPVDPNNIVTLETAEIALIQEFLHGYLDSRGRFEDMYTQYNIRPGAMHIASALATNYRGSRLDESEFDRINLDRLFLVLTSHIHHFLTTRSPNVPEHEILNTLDHNSPQEFPWFHLIMNLFLQGRLPRFIQTIGRYTRRRAPVASLNAATATVYIARVGFEYYVTYRPQFPFVFLSYYSLTQAIPKLMHNYVVALRNHILTFVREELDTADRLLRMGEDIAAGLMLHTTAIAMVCSLPVFDADTYTQYLEGLEQINDMTIPCLQRDELTHLDIEELSAERRALGYDYLCDQYRNLPWPDYEHLSTLEENDGRTRIAMGIINGFGFDIVCATLSDCVTIVMNNPTVDDRDPDMFNAENNMDADEDTLHPLRVRWQERTNRTYRINRIELPVDVRPIPAMEPYPFASEIPLLDPCDPYRIYGSATNAMSRFADTFSQMGIRGPQARPVQALVVGDGLGGSSSFLCTTFPDSYITICTLREEVGQAAVPDIVQEYALANRCVIDATAFTEDRTDVSDPNNLYALELEHLRYNIVISDIEPHGPNDNNDPIYWIYTAQFYLRNRSLSGMLVMQIRLNHMRYVVKLVCLLYQYVTDIILYKPMTMTRNDGAMLIAYGNRKAYIDGYSLAPPPNSDALIALVQAFARIQSERCTQLSRLEGNTIAFIGVEYGLLSPWLTSLTLLATIEMERKFGYAIDFDYARELAREGTLASSIMRQLYPYEIEKSYDYYIKSVTADYDVLVVDANVGANRRAHAQLMYERALRCQGFMYTYRYLMVNEMATISDQIIRGWYVLIINSAPRRLQIPRASNEHFAYEMNTRDGIPIRPFRHYMSGVKRAIMFASTVHHIAWAARNEQG